MLGLPNTQEQPISIGISGFGGSGKSTLSRRLVKQLHAAEVISMDEFWVPERDVRLSDWTVFDRDRLEHQVLIPATQGNPIRYQVFDWHQGKLKDWREIEVVDYLIIEGISALHPTLLPYYRFKIWVDCSLEVAQQRGLRRGTTEYNIDETESWVERWTPNDRVYFQKYRPDLQANFLYPTF
ncbi:MAG: AAA family ATPase [Myxacorys chilensis ATA2-1-KO14]|nr:AAA family ATPase [Myxacorys chilensis ATA2-1-KO14]